jgi:hypothetical protein
MYYLNLMVSGNTIVVLLFDFSEIQFDVFTTSDPEQCAFECYCSVVVFRWKYASADIFQLLLLRRYVFNLNANSASA